MSNKKNNLDISFDLEDIKNMDDLENYEETDLDIIEDMEDIRVSLELEDGTSYECSILTIYEIDGQDYIALLPLEDDDETPCGDVLVMRYAESEDGEPSIEDIQDQEEMELAVNTLAEIMEEEDIDISIEE